MPPNALNPRSQAGNADPKSMASIGGKSRLRTNTNTAMRPAGSRVKSIRTAVFNAISTFYPLLASLFQI